MVLVCAGINNPVTKSTAGDAYHAELARQLGPATPATISCLPSHPKPSSLSCLQPQTAPTRPTHSPVIAASTSGA